MGPHNLVCSRPQTLAAPPTGLTASLAGEKPPHRAQLTCSGRQRRSCATPALRARSLVRWSRVLSGHKRCLASGYWELFDCYCVVAARSAAGSEGVSMEETRRQEARRARMTARRTSSLRLDAAAEMIGHSGSRRPTAALRRWPTAVGDPFAAGCAVSLCHVGVGRDAAFEVCCITGATS